MDNPQSRTWSLKPTSPASDITMLLLITDCIHQGFSFLTAAAAEIFFFLYLLTVPIFFWTAGFQDKEITFSWKLSVTIFRRFISVPFGLVPNLAE